jgi:hypothetical protein
MTDKWVYVGGPSGADGQGGASQVLAAHAALLPIGDKGCILYYGGDQWLPPETWEEILTSTNTPEDSPNFPAGFAEINHSRMFDCATAVITDPLSPPSDIFCSGHAFLGDGRLAVIGGTQHFPAELTNLHSGHFRKTSSCSQYNSWLILF